MPYVHTIAAWTSPSVQKKWDPFLILVQYEIEVSMTEDESSTEHAVRLVSGDFLESVQQQLVNPLGAESIYKLVVINSPGVSLLVQTSRDIERSDNLFFRFGLLGSFCKGKGCQSWGLSRLILDF